MAVKPVNGATPSAPAQTAATPVAPPPAADPPEIRRGPGRPRKDGAAATNGARPGRPSKRKAKVEFDAEQKSVLAKQIFGLHQLAALSTGIGEIQITLQESEMLGGAVAAVCEEYDLSIDGKTGALLQLAAACGMVYVPRFLAMTARVKRQKEARDIAAAPTPDASANGNAAVN